MSGTFSLNKRVGEALFCGVIGGAEAVHVMCDLMDQNVVEVKIAEVIKVAVAAVERVSAEKDALPPIEAIAAKRTGP